MRKKEHPYTKILKAFSDADMALIVQLKRFFEWMEGDRQFAAAVLENQLPQKQLERLKKIGVKFNLQEIAPIWESPDFFLKYSAVLSCNVTGMKPDVKEKEIINQYPLLSLWFKYSMLKKDLYLNSRKRVWRIPKNRKLDRWRLRRICSAKSELGLFGYHIDHPVFAFEFGDGCSVGCWFCAFGSKKLTRNFDYEKNSVYFKKIVQRCVNLFGKDGAGMALLYYGTEPHDNPGYINFIKDYHTITGHPVCTSTTAGTDSAWLRELIAYYREGNFPWPRLSILTREMLYAIHELYTPEELRDVTLLMQMKDHQRNKVTGGRILKEHNGLKERDPGHYLDAIVPQGSIACVSGFLVNMVQQTIELISPCYTTEKWPYGYRVFDKTSFGDDGEFQEGIERLIERNMVENPLPEAVAEFRDDLDYRPTENGFDLVSLNQIHHFKGNNLYTDIGSRIAIGNLTYKQLFDRLVDEKSHNPLAISAFVRQLFDGGLLNEKYH